MGHNSEKDDNVNILRIGDKQLLKQQHGFGSINKFTVLDLSVLAQLNGRKF